MSNPPDRLALLSTALGTELYQALPDQRRVVRSRKSRMAAAISAQSIPTVRVATIGRLKSPTAAVGWVYMPHESPRVTQRASMSGAEY
jgi:hypothetical protein